MMLKTFCLLFVIVMNLFVSYGEVSKVSERPKNVEVEQIGTNGTSLYVTWDPPEVDIESLLSCPLRGYVVRLKSSREGQQQKWNVDADRRSLTLHDVREATTYHVRVSTARCRGSSKSSRWVTIQTKRHQKRGTVTNTITGPETSSPGKPQFVSTVAFADYVILTWEPPSEQVTVRGYMIGYGEGVPDVNWQYVDKENRNVTIRNLKSSTQYVLSVRAFNNYGKGTVVYDLIYTKDKIESGSYTVSSPLSPPSNVRAKVLSPTTVWLQWTDPSLGRQQQISDNRYYNVHYQAMPQGKTLSVIVKALHVVLYDLASGTDYAFKVRTVNEAQSSAFSATVHNKTISAAPSSPPRGLEVFQTADSSAVSVRWKPPKSSSDVTGYLVMYTSEPEKETSMWQVLAVGGTLTETLLTNLHASLTYYFKVQARNAMGYGPFSDVVVYTVQQESWLSSSSKNATTENGSVSLPEAPLVVMQAAARRLEHGIGGLESGNYSQLVAPLAEQQTGMQSSVEVTALVHHTVSAVISWKLACNAHSADTYVPPQAATADVKYELRYHDTQRPLDVITHVLSSTVAFIDGLLPNRIYKYQITVHNSFLPSWSVEGLLSTALNN